jgi:hypothetical protein
LTSSEEDSSDQSVVDADEQRLEKPTFISVEGPDEQWGAGGVSERYLAGVASRPVTQLRPRSDQVIHAVGG